MSAENPEVSTTVAPAAPVVKPPVIIYVKGVSSTPIASMASKLPQPAVIAEKILDARAISAQTAPQIAPSKAVLVAPKLKAQVNVAKPLAPVAVKVQTTIKAMPPRHVVRAKSAQRFPGIFPPMKAK